MNVKAYIDYIRDGRKLAGVYMDDFVVYVREEEPSTSDPLQGYIELRLNEGVPRTWESIQAVLRDAYARIGTPADNSFHHIDTSLGNFELLYRDGVPATAEQAATELRHYFQRITHDGRTYEFPQGD